jgi:signal transduction histidine kinase
MMTLRSVSARIACVIRCIAIAYIGVQVLIWHSFYADDFWRLAGPLAAAVWAAAVVAYLPRHWPAGEFVVLDSAVYVLLALGAGWCVPPAMRGDTANWLYIMMAGQLLVPAWFAPVALAAPLALASGASYWAGAALITASGSGGSSPSAAGALLLAVAAAVWCGRLSLYRWATGADLALARADRDSREQYVVLSRNLDRREHERLLHDTVLNTLTALQRAGGDKAGVVGRCRHDVTLMEYLLTEPGDSAMAASQPAGGLLAGIEAVVAEMRARGLDVQVEVTAGVPAPARRGRESGVEPSTPEALAAGVRPTNGTGGVAEAKAPVARAGGPVVPPPVAVAIAHAVREALTNVASHSGTSQAWVEVSRGTPDCIQVTVRDAGMGFDPAYVDPARLGLRRSIIERIADWGGHATIRSAPGEGTTVILRWTAPVPPAAVPMAVGISGGTALPW